MLPGPLVVVARIVKPHGLRGEVVLESFTDVKGRIETTPIFVLMARGVAVREVHVESRRFFNGRNVLRFRGIETLTEAEKIRGMELGVPESEIGDLPDDHYYVHELVGCAARLKDGTELGVVQSVLATGGVDVLEIGERKQYLVPFTEEICVEVNLEEKYLVIDPPEGLLNLNAR